MGTLIKEIIKLTNCYFGRAKSYIKVNLELLTNSDSGNFKLLIYIREISLHFEDQVPNHENKEKFRIWSLSK